MADYIILCRFTQQGIEKLKDSPNRFQAWKKMLSDANVKLKSHHVVLGQYDIIETIEAPDDETMARLSLQIASLGNIRVETLRAFNQEQFVEMVSTMK